MPRTEGRVNWTQVIATAAVSTGVGMAVERAITDADDTTDDGTTNGSVEPQTSGTEETMSQELQELVDIERRRNPGPEAVDAFSGQTIDLSDGQTATVTVTPADGYDLRVKKSYFDRRQNHAYVHNVGGIEVSTSHEAILKATRRVSHGGQVVAEVTNNDGSASELDYELEAWAIPTGVA